MSTVVRALHFSAPPGRRWFVGLGLLMTLWLAFFATTLTAQAAAAPVNAEPITIPFIATAPKLDGLCDVNGEYGNALIGTVFYAPGGGGKVYLMHDNTNLYVCLFGATGK